MLLLAVLRLLSVLLLGFRGDVVVVVALVGRGGGSGCTRAGNHCLQSSNGAGLPASLGRGGRGLVARRRRRLVSPRGPRVGYGGRGRRCRRPPRRLPRRVDRRRDHRLLPRDGCARGRGCLQH